MGHNFASGETRARASAEPRPTNRRRLSWFAGLLALMLIAAACSSGGATDVEEAAERRSAGGREIIRFAFAPDPVWDYMKDTGVLHEWQEEHGLRIVTSESWSEFDYFANGHGDIVSMASHELPLLEQESGIKVTAFGIYNHDRTSLMRRRDDDYNTIADLPEDANVCVGSAVSTTILWSVIADQLHNLDLRVGEGDFELSVHDYFEIPAMLESGECTVGMTLPEAAVPQLRTGDFQIMYDGRPPWQVWADDVCQCEHRGIMSNLFVAREEWFDSHPEQAAAFLELWERGLELWNENKDEIIRLYPVHFAVETEPDTEWVIDYMSGDDDFFVDSVYMDQEWVDRETQLYDDMRESGWMEQNTQIPRFEVLPPPS
jgi:ABC-type nitrate/sulfonate/bicarbonate transport system substrate-binding protein